MAFRKIVRRAKKAVVGAAKKRYAPKGKINYAKIAQDAAKLVKLMNVEKKYIDTSHPTRGFAQFNYNTFEVTPAIAQGITGNTRNGNSLKLVSARIDFQIKTQVSVVNAFKYKYFLVCKPTVGTGTNTTNVTTQFLDLNIFSSAYDYHSQRDPEFFRDFRVICQGQGTLLPENIVGQTGIAQFSRNLKLSHHLKYDSDATTTTTSNGMYLILVGDSGDQTLSTGCIADIVTRFWYVDN